MSKHVAVLMGGLSVEREVSLVSGDECARALESRGYRVTRVDAGHDLPRKLDELQPDCVFNALHGRLGEDGRVQGLLDWMRIPYTHSGVLASAIAMDKPMALRLFGGAGMRTPEGRVMTLAEVLAAPPFDAPYVVKPAAEGSSVGVTIIHEEDSRALSERNDVDPKARVLVERYIPGRELTCAILGDRALTVTEIAPNKGFYDYCAKYTEGYASHILPAPVEETVLQQVQEWSLAAHRLLGCRGVSRSDFRYDPARGESGLFILEINTQPGMTPLSLVPEQAAHCGMEFADLLVELVEAARCDF
ncbi:MAG: D-alanine--D-alanine ligase [Geminicoccaceae bacterium]|nr:D-alanine--D-alanine ligase [Geminicoccaceae bacterium]